MKKIKPIVFSNIEEINNWLAKNFDDYLETIQLLEENLYHIIDVKQKANASVKYSAERLFCFYYESLKGLLILKNKDENLKQFIDGYHSHKNDKKLLENWYSNIDYNIHKIDSNYSSMCFIEYDNGNPIGIKPYESIIYKENPYVLPIDGFENLIELAKLINLNQENYLYGQSPEGL
ncbi:hypothetical protein FCOL_11460 [Flavobacterium columnare ATCC 49512]|uniref:Uncharacterized protein n=1 Tax=Flavobacterium columnare (strain ATCC 49512 / CIP 103533 / TG 44/87) TaxID=1041826 RepID=G8X7Y1_FLACA|nr:hypothetical protein [Flavobacterium columnare]AEW87095.1 hypothetical protein FCOL_11460 [Flavobacterium columnare ATCC 49512]